MQVNVTVDDNSPQFTYSPEAAWNFGPSCTRCGAKVDESQTLSFTWHDATFYPPTSHGEPTAGEKVSLEINFLGVFERHSDGSNLGWETIEGEVKDGLGR